MEQKIRERQRQLCSKALSLRERVIEYYRSRGDPEPDRGLAKLLQHIADKLNQEPPDVAWLKANTWGIYHVVSDSYMEKTALGKDLYHFEDRLDEFVAMFERGGKDTPVAFDT